MILPSDDLDPPPDTSSIVLHKNLRQCERHFREVYPDCGQLAAGVQVSCACGRSFVHAHYELSLDEPGVCYWALRESAR